MWKQEEYWASAASAVWDKTDFIKLELQKSVLFYIAIENWCQKSICFLSLKKNDIVIKSKYTLNHLYEVKAILFIKMLNSGFLYFLNSFSWNKNLSVSEFSMKPLTIEAKCSRPG